MRRKIYEWVNKWLNRLLFAVRFSEMLRIAVGWKRYKYGRYAGMSVSDVYMYVRNRCKHCSHGTTV